MIIKIILIIESNIIIVIIRLGDHEFYGPELSSKSSLSTNQKSKIIIVIIRLGDHEFYGPE